MKPGETVTPKLLAKQQELVDKLVAEKTKLEVELSREWQLLRRYRFAAIEVDIPLAPLPLVGDLERTSQENSERQRRENHAITTSPEHRRALADLNSAA